MIFHPPLIEAQLIRRYKRFCVEAKLPSQEVIQGYCPNTGSMKSCSDSGAVIYLLKESSPTRKLSYTWELTKTAGGYKTEGVKEGYVGVNTHRSNDLVAEALRDQVIPEFTHYKSFKREVTPHILGKTRLDFLLTGPSDTQAYLEVKNVTLYDQKKDAVLFPDAPSLRAQKHLKVLTELARQGLGAYLLFVVNRPEGRRFLSADHIDPEYGQLLRHAQKSGVKVLAYVVKASVKDIILTSKSLQVDL